MTKAVKQALDLYYCTLSPQGKELGKKTGLKTISGKKTVASNFKGLKTKSPFKPVSTRVKKGRKTKERLVKK